MIRFMLTIIAVLAAAAAALVWLVHSLGIVGFAIFVVLAIPVWLGLTWYFRDNKPTLAPWEPGRVTFKEVVRDAINDVGEFIAPVTDVGLRVWRWASPKVTNPTTWAAIVTNAALAWPLVTENPAGQAMLREFPALYFVGAFVALIATRQANAPYRVPAAGPSPTGGLTNNTALA